MIGSFIPLLLIYGSLCLPVTGYLMQEVSQCRFSDDQRGNITFSSRYTCNGQIVLEYSNVDDMYVPCSDSCMDVMGNVSAKFSFLLNTNPDTATRVKQERERCKEEVKTFWGKTVERRVKPSVEVYYPVQLHNENLPLLICHVSGFYPKDINVAWFKNDRLVQNSTEAVRAGDWTYIIVSALDMRDSLPEDNYTCLVIHRSLDTPIVMNWKHGLTNTQIIKISVASVVFALGLVCLMTGVYHWKNAKRSEVPMLDIRSAQNVSTSPLIPRPLQSLEEEDLELWEENETRSVQGELWVGELSSLSSWGAPSDPFYQGCALRSGDDGQADDRRCVPI